jgi:uncharacterized protein involved in type VI secretion and phage assembly
MGMFDSLEDPLGEVGDALSDMGAIDEADADNLDAATRAIQTAIDQNGVPLARPRFLIGNPVAGKIPTDQTSYEDAIKQAGHIADNLLQMAGIGAPSLVPGGPGGPASYGELAAAIATRALHDHAPGPFPQSPYEQPLHFVDDFYVEEGINRVWRAFVTLTKPSQAYVPGAFVPVDPEADIGQAFGIEGDGSDVADLNKLVGDVMQGIFNPETLAAQVWDAQDPDSIDVPNLPADHKQTLTRVTATRYLGQFARLSVARRFPTSHFTLNERWFTGIVTGFEDLGIGASDDWRRIRLTLRPRLHQLSLRKRYRVFKGLNAVEIVIKILEEHQIYPKDPGATGLTALRLLPGGKELFGPVGLPDAFVGAADKLTGAIDGMAAEFGQGPVVGDKLTAALAQDIDKWRPKREYCVQYGETDLEFFERLLAEEGLAFFFECKERRETLVICEDARLAGKKVLTAARLPLSVVPTKQPPTAGVTVPVTVNEEVWDLAIKRTPVSSGVTLRDRNYARPSAMTDLKAGEAPELLSPASLSSLGSVGGIEQMANQLFGMAKELAGIPGTEDYAGPEAQLFEWPTRVGYPFKPNEPLPYESYDGPPIDAIRALGAVAQGTSECATLAPGANVRIDSGGFDVLHPPVQKPQRLLVTKVTHAGSTGAINPNPNPNIPTVVLQPGQVQPLNIDLNYTNTFEALNIAMAYRPPPPAKRPRIAGVQTAIVIDTAFEQSPTSNEEVSTADKEHAWRVRVRFAWERGDAVSADGTKDGSWGSPWLRFAQPFSGASFGALFVPRVGMEVLVGFDEGDPDRPYVLGALYNAMFQADGARHASSPKPDAQSGPINAHQARLTDSGFTTRSWPDPDHLGEGIDENLLRFEDLDDTTSEEDRKKGSGRIRVWAKKDLAEEAGGDHITTVLHDQTNDVVTGKQTEIVWRDQTLLARYESKDDGDFGRKVTIQADEEIHVGGGPGEDKPDYPYEKAESTPAGFLMHDDIKKNDKLLVGGERTLEVDDGELIRIKGDGASDANPGRWLSIVKDSTVDIDMDDIIDVGGSRSVTADGALKLTAAQISMTTGGKPDASGQVPETGGLKIDDKGISLASSGTLSIEAPLAFHAESTADRVLVRAKNQILLSDAGLDNAIMLDAESKKILIHALAGTRIMLEAGGSQLELKQDAIHIVSGPSTWQVTLGSDGTWSKMDGPMVTIDATDEIYLNAPEVNVGQPNEPDEVG